MKIAIIGYGSRGRLYASELKKANDVEVVAVCDIRADKLEQAKCECGEKTLLFNATETFFAQGKLADMCVIATQDATHEEYAIKAMSLGYDLLLEKPIAVTEKGCQAIYEASKRYQRNVYVCHVLRYAPFFATIKRELDSGKYGKIAVINLTENVGHWHQAHSYVRGAWADTTKSSPMIIAKSCHDLDIISYFVGKKCKSVSSIGSLEFFTRKNAPKNSGERCLDCPVKKDCVYDAEKYYITDEDSWTDKTLDTWPRNTLATSPTREKLYEAIKNGPYGRCVFKCDNDAVDRQIVNIAFEDGVLASFVMTAFTADSYREIHIHCEKGDIFGSMAENKLTCSLFGTCKETAQVTVIDLAKESEEFAGHGGGDARLVRDVLSNMRGEAAEKLTVIENSLRSHFIGFAAEKSRLLDGAVVNVNK